MDCEIDSVRPIGSALQKNKSNTFTTTIGVNTACFSRSIIPPFRRLTATQFLAIGRRASFHTIALLLHRHTGTTFPLNLTTRDAPDFVEVGEAGIAVDDAIRRRR